MKFTIPFSAVIAASAVLGNVLPRDDKFYDEYSEICQRAMIDCGKLSKECFLNKMVEEAPEEFCSTIYNSDKCQGEQYSQCISTLSKCNGEPQSGAINLLEHSKKQVGYMCNTVENNQLCPVFRKENLQNLNKGINETCKSKICTDATYNYYEIPLGTTDLEQFKGRVIDKDFNYEDYPFASENKYNKYYYAMYFLKSEYCTSQQAKTEAVNSGNNTNNANTVNTNANTNATNSITTNQQSSDAITSIKLNVFGILLAIAYTLL
ncbi:hypothetical protein PIROE2DRAFT_11023 [Piromyces sp. E2]|nr:hypothetical protein PIROE2DRAFT_11023 [Piromyces sp. E2]|eukprot:OUM62647.1 hypothetical protein PIROE2DRAFT_11023 [Piromyces sp. E2]